MISIFKKKLEDSRISIKIILDIWTILTIFLFIFDFLSGNKFDSSVSAIGVIYLAILGIYTGEKEYDRWKTRFISRFSGELYVVIWTIIMVIFAILAPFSNGYYKIPAEFALVYTSVVGVFAITRHSRDLHEKKHRLLPKIK